MEYSLAKELKDAGFPQGEPGSSIRKLFPSEYVGQRSVPEELFVYTPILSELIEACGEKFGSLNGWPDAPASEKWEATDQPDFLKEAGQVHHSIVVQGATPEEAVARLWLAINKK